MSSRNPSLCARYPLQPCRDVGQAPLPPSTVTLMDTTLDSRGRRRTRPAGPGCRSSANRLLAHEGQAPFARRPAGPIARLERQARSDRYEKPDNIEPALAAEPTENTEATEPAEPMDRIDPAEPMDRIEPLEPIDRIDPLDPMLSSDPAEPAVDASRVVRMITFSQHGPVRARTSRAESQPYVTRPVWRPLDLTPGGRGDWYAGLGCAP